MRAELLSCEPDWCFHKRVSREVPSLIHHERSKWSATQEAFPFSKHDHSGTMTLDLLLATRLITSFPSGLCSGGQVCCSVLSPSLSSRLSLLHAGTPHPLCHGPEPLSQLPGLHDRSAPWLPYSLSGFPGSERRI